MRSPVALVVLLRGVNVGGHRTFRPAALVKELEAFDAVNVGAAGTFVIRKAIAVARLRAEIARRLPFETEIVICPGKEIVGLLSTKAFTGELKGTDIVRFVSVLSRAPRSSPTLPLSLPDRGKWLLRLVARDGRYVFGEYRREMKAIGYLGKLDDVFGVPATTRNWNTIRSIAEVVGGDER